MRNRKTPDPGLAKKEKAAEGFGSFLLNDGLILR